MKYQSHFWKHNVVDILVLKVPYLNYGYMVRKKKIKLDEKIIDGFDSQDIIAIIVIVGGFILMAFKIDTVIAGLMTLVAGFYFGKKTKQ